MPSWGMEFELVTPMVLRISRIEVIHLLPDISPRKEIVVLNPRINLGPTRDEEIQGLFKILNLARASMGFELISEAYLRKTHEDELTLYGETIDLITGLFPKIPAFNRNIIFSADHGIGIIPEIITKPFGTSNTDVPLSLAPEFLRRLLIRGNEIMSTGFKDNFSCSHKGMEKLNLTYNPLQNLKLIIFGEVEIFSSKDGIGQQLTTIVDLTWFTNTPFSREFFKPVGVSDPLRALIDLNDTRYLDLGEYYTFLDISRNLFRDCVFPEVYLSRPWVEGCFGYAIFSALSLAVGSMQGGSMKSLWLLYPKTTPILVLTSAFKHAANIYNILANHFFNGHVRLPSYSRVTLKRCAEASGREENEIKSIFFHLFGKQEVNIKALLGALILYPMFDKVTRFFNLMHLVPSPDIINYVNKLFSLIESIFGGDSRIGLGTHTGLGRPKFEVRFMELIESDTQTPNWTRIADIANAVSRCRFGDEIMREGEALRPTSVDRVSALSATDETEDIWIPFTFEMGARRKYLQRP